MKLLIRALARFRRNAAIGAIVLAILGLAACQSPFLHAGEGSRSAGNHPAGSTSKPNLSPDPGSNLKEASGTGDPAGLDAGTADEESGNGTPRKTKQPPASRPEPQTRHAVLIAVGDIMVHTKELAAARDPKDPDEYDFRPFFKNVKGILRTGDWVTGNLETTLAGEQYGGYTGYPRFNSPPAMAVALKDAGFNIITNANNHAMDRGAAGVMATLRHLHDQGLLTKGTAASQKEADTPLIVEKNGIKLGFLAYTYGTNGIPIPQNMPYLVPLINEKKIKADIANLKQAGADMVAVSIHWGYEYHEEPNTFQEDLAKKIVSDGADIVLGSHPHVVEPYQWIQTRDALGHTHKGLVIYSLGNFISDQEHFHAPYKPTDLGVIFKVAVSKSPDGICRIDSARAIPTYVQHYRQTHRTQYRILPLGKILDAPHDDPLLTAEDYAMLQHFYTQMLAHVTSMLPQ